MRKLILIALSAVLANCCQDRVHNVINMRDCGGRGALVRFRNLKLYTYDNSKRPKCFGGEANVGLPGFLKLASGQILVSRNLELKKNPAELLLTLQKNDIFINTICNKGSSANIAVLPNTCRASLCGTLGAGFCAFIDKKGNHNLDKQPPNWHTFMRTDIADLIVKLLLKGQWKGELHIQQRGRIVGCLAVPANNQGWMRVDQ